MPSLKAFEFGWTREFGRDENADFRTTSTFFHTRNLSLSLAPVTPRDTDSSRDAVEVFERAAAGARDVDALQQRGDDATPAGRLLHRTRPKVARIAGGVRLQRGNAEGLG